MSYTDKNFGGYPNRKLKNLGSQREETGGRQK